MLLLYLELLQLTLEEAVLALMEVRQVWGVLVVVHLEQITTHSQLVLL